MAKTLAQRYGKATPIAYANLCNTACYLFFEPDEKDKNNGIDLIVCTNVGINARTNYRRLKATVDKDGECILHNHTWGSINTDDVMRYVI